MGLSLTIDQGNSSAKLSVFADNKIIHTERHDSITADAVAAILHKYGIRRAIYSSVTGDDEAITALLGKLDLGLVLSHKLPMPLTIRYASPATLGHDRIAEAVGAAALKPGRNILVVDLGTAITYDLVTADRRFAGGNIAPGVHARLSALAECCAKLPLIGPEGETPLLGYDTTTAIRSGVMLGIAAEIRDMAGHLSGMHSGLCLMLTGGDSPLIEPLVRYLKPTVEQNLVTIGLNSILQYNEHI